MSGGQEMKTINFYKLTLVKEKEISYACSESLTSPDAVAKLAIDFIGMDKFAEEHMYLIALNVKNYVNGLTEISHGALSFSIVHPREIFKYAISMNAASIMLIHNHPSGDPTPSEEDVAMTKRIQEAGELLGINLLDHIIVADGKFASLREKGLL
jgi:DNA repair protein RadC